MSREPSANGYANHIVDETAFGAAFSAAFLTSPTPIPASTAPPRGIDVVVQLCVAVIQDPGENGRSKIQVLSPYNQRIPVPLDHVRSFSGVKRCLRNLLKDTLAQYGTTPIQMTQAAAILPTTRYTAHSGFLGMTDDHVTWQNYLHTIASMYHAPCGDPSNCMTCRDPAFIVACFPARDWTSIPLSRGILMLDDCCEEHSQTLSELSLFERDRYVRITQGDVSAESATSARDSRQNSTNSTSSQPQSTLRSAATRGPKGRSLTGSGRHPSTKVVDYSQGTLFPSTAQQGIKAESDICLTCLKYGRKCKGTTMKFVRSSRSNRPSQWKCECCQNPQRRCVWRPSMDEVTPYEEAFRADGGVSLLSNTVQGRLDRAIMRHLEMVKMEAEMEEEEDADADDEVDEEDYEDEQDSHGEADGFRESYVKSEGDGRQADSESDTYIKREAE